MAEELLVSQMPSIYLAQLYLRTSSCSCFTFFGGWWQDLHSSHRETLHSTKRTKNAKKTESPLRGSTSCAAALRRAAQRMMGLGKRFWEPPLFDDKRKNTGKPSRVRLQSVCQGGAEGSSLRWWFPWVNLRHSLQVGAWNVLSLIQ